MTATSPVGPRPAAQKPLYSSEAELKNKAKKMLGLSFDIGSLTAPQKQALKVLYSLTQKGLINTEELQAGIKDEKGLKSILDGLANDNTLKATGYFAAKPGVATIGQDNFSAAVSIIRSKIVPEAPAPAGVPAPATPGPETAAE